MTLILGILLAPIMMILMAPAIGILWFLMTLAWVTKDLKKPEQPELDSGPMTNKIFKWLWWKLTLLFSITVDSDWFRVFEPQSDNFPKWAPKWFVEWLLRWKSGVLEKVGAMILFTCLGIMYGFLNGWWIGFKLAKSILEDISSEKEDIHNKQDTLFTRTGIFTK